MKNKRRFVFCQQNKPFFIFSVCIGLHKRDLYAKILFGRGKRNAKDEYTESRYKAKQAVRLFQKRRVALAFFVFFYFRQKLRSVRQSFQRGFRPHGGGRNDVRFAVRAQRAGTFLFRGQSRRCRSCALHGYFQRVQGDFRVRSQRAEFGCEICRKACRRLR